MSKILVTGATGGLDSAVVDFLLEKKVEAKNIAVLVRNAESEKAQNLKSKGVDLRVGDYNDQASLVKAFEGIDNLYFVSSNDVSVRIEQHQKVVSASKESGVKYMIYTSSARKSDSADSPLYPVLSSHITTEKLIQESGINYTIARHNLYTEVIPMFLGEKAQVLQNKTVYLPTGKGKTAFVPRIDLAESGAIMLSNPEPHLNKIYDFNGSELTTFEQVT